MKNHNKRLERELERSKTQMKQLKKELKRLKSTKFHKEKMKTTLKKSFSSTQVKKILHPERKFIRNYKKEDVVNGLILKSISNRAFNFVKSKNILSLPCRTTQEKFIKDFKCEPGLLSDGIGIVEKKLQSSESTHEKFAALCFDEMDIQKVYEYCQRSQKVYGPHKKIQVVQARGLAHS